MLKRIKGPTLGENVQTNLELVHESTNKEKESLANTSSAHQASLKNQDISSEEEKDNSLSHDSKS